jgi:division/cell wall cluster transcriptional repressor MraZ
LGAKNQKVVMQLIGEFEVKVDDKGRIMVPVGLRRQLPTEMQDRFVLNRGFENCVAMTPYPLWVKESERINKLNSNRKLVREYQRFFANGATELILDNSGRMLIPKHLQDPTAARLKSGPKTVSELLLPRMLSVMQTWQRKFSETKTVMRFDVLP